MGARVTVTVTTPVAVPLETAEVEDLEEAVAVAESDDAIDVVEEEWVLERCFWVRVLPVLVDAAADTDVDADAAVLEERLEELSVALPSSSSSQSVGKSTMLLVLFTAIPPVAPVARMSARAV